MIVVREVKVLFASGSGMRPNFTWLRIFFTVIMEKMLTRMPAF